MLLPYKLMSYRDTTYVVRSRTMTQHMLLGHDRTIYVIHNITYDVMSLIATCRYPRARVNNIIKLT
jgi:hypothetical protein